MRYKLFLTLFMNHVLGIRLYPKIISKKIARPLLLDIQNDSCLMCLETFSDKIPSEIHHIDHNSKNNVFGKRGNKNNMNNGYDDDGMM